MIEEEIKKRFKDCMEQMYPKGCDDLVQIRDMMRIFVMGCMEYGMYLVDPAKVLTKAQLTPEMEKLMEFADLLTTSNWKPDISYKWW
jgi:hypothetical protein